MQLKKFAELMGVSRATVSLAMNNSPNVAAATKKRIQEAAKKFGYFPSPQGRALRRGRSNMIGCILPNLNNSFFDVLFCSISQKCAQMGYALLSVHINKDANSAPAVRMLLEHGVEGIIFLATPCGNNWQSLIRLRKTPVVIYNMPDMTEFSTVQTDDLIGGEIAMKCLLDNGHRHILCSSRQALRIQGNMNACAEHNDSRIIPYNKLNEVAALLKQHPEVTAIVAYSDDEAIDMIRMMKKQNIRIPEDISLIGFDDMRYSSWEEFDLTTIAQPQTQMGIILCELLINRINNSQLPVECIKITPELVVRSTVKNLQK